MERHVDLIGIPSGEVLYITVNDMVNLIRLELSRWNVSNQEFIFRDKDLEDIKKICKLL